MANASIAVGTYNGEAARPYVSAAILSADTIANGYCSVLENVHSKAVLRKFTGVEIQAQDCSFTTPTGSLTLGEAVLTTTALKVNEQVCNKDLRATWEGMQTSLLLSLNTSPLRWPRASRATSGKVTTTLTAQAQALPLTAASTACVK